METVVAAAALGIAGLDPAGALILVAALAADARRRGAAAFTVAALAGAGALFALTAVPDPSWLALIVLAGRAESVGVVVLAHVLWIVISQLPLLLIFGAVLTGRHERAVAAFQRTWARFRPRIYDAATTLIAAATAFFAVDAGWYLLTGRLLVD